MRIRYGNLCGSDYGRSESVRSNVLRICLIKSIILSITRTRLSDMETYRALPCLGLAPSSRAPRLHSPSPLRTPHAQLSMSFLWDTCARSWPVRRNRSSVRRSAASTLRSGARGCHGRRARTGSTEGRLLRRRCLQLQGRNCAAVAAASSCRDATAQRSRATLDRVP